MSNANQNEPKLMKAFMEAYTLMPSSYLPTSQMADAYAIGAWFMAFGKPVPQSISKSRGDSYRIDGRVLKVTYSGVSEVGKVARNGPLGPSSPILTAPPAMYYRG